MADVKKLRLGDVTYDIKDAEAREYLVVVDETPHSATKVKIDTTVTSVELPTIEDLNLTNARIDNITAPSGDPSLTELADIRVGADNVTYSTAGVSVRTQITNLQNQLTNYTNRLQGLKLGIVGDSISTYSGYIPSGYVSFYPENTVQNVDQTWWKQLLDETGMELCVNASWSGSTICGDTTRADGYVGCSDARVSALTKGNGAKPDIIICFMGINDFAKDNNIVCGTYEGKTTVPTATTINAITEAYGVLLKKLQVAYPNARIFVCRILPEQFASEMSDSYANGFPIINPNDSVTLTELNERIEKIANAFGCGVIPMDKCGATFFNIMTYTGDGLHPNALLTPKMCQVAKQAIMDLF